MAGKRLHPAGASLLVAVLTSLGGAGCSDRVAGSTLACDHDDDCAAGRCEAGRCRVDVDGGAPLLDAGAHDGAHGHDGGSFVDTGVVDDSGPRGDGGRKRDAGRVDAGDVAAGHLDAGEEHDGGAAGADAGAPLVDGGNNGGVCSSGCPGVEHRAPIEVCADGYDNDCDGSVDEQPCGLARTIALEAGDALPAGYSIQVPVPSSLLGVTDGSDVRVWRFDNVADGFVQMPRVLDPDESWDAPTTIWFPLAADVAAASQDERYRLTWGTVPDDAGPPLDDEDEVFHFADFFEWGPSENGAPAWSIVDDPSQEDIDVDGGALLFVAAKEADGSPHASRDFQALSGPFSFDVRFHWAGVDGDGADYAWRLVLGDVNMGAAPPTNDEIEPTGIGPNLLWSGGTPSFTMPFQHALAVDGQPAELSGGSNEPTIAVLGETGVNASTRVLIEGSTSTRTFTVHLDGTPYGPYTFADDTVVSLSRIRMYTSEITITSTSGFSPARFDHVILRPRVATEPSVSLVRPAGCL